MDDAVELGPVGAHNADAFDDDVVQAASGIDSIARQKDLELIVLRTDRARSLAATPRLFWQPFKKSSQVFALAGGRMIRTYPSCRHIPKPLDLQT
jgi:hypothetical protein